MKIAVRIWQLIEDTIRFVLVKVLRLDLSEEAWKGIIQFVKFGIVGVSNTLLSYLIYVVSLKLLRQRELFSSVDIYVAQFIAFVLSVAWAFYWNNKMVFKQNDGENRNIFKALLKTYVSYAFTGLFLAEVLLILWIEVLGINEFIAPVISLIITVPLNFAIQKFWAFKK